MVSRTSEPLRSTPTITGQPGHRPQLALIWCRLARLKTVTAKMEPWVKEVEPMDRFQFERLGFFVVDKDSTPDKIRFNRIVTLRDSWAKIMKKAGK